MSTLKNLVHEIHRRSLWQVLGIFLAASWGVIEVVDLLTEQVGLPDWTPMMAMVLLLIGLPIVLATAVVQEGMPGADGSPADGEPDSAAGAATEHATVAGKPENLAAGTGSLDVPTTRPSQTKRLFTWRNAILGGVGAFTLLGFSLFAYFVMWTSGIGPVGNLVAQGVLEEKDPVVLSVFEDATGEGVGGVVTEALRVDLLESPVLTIVTAGQLSQALALMDLPTETELTPALAREVAVRGGYKAFIRGEVALAGSAYVLSAAVVSAASGDELKAFRVTARSADDLVDAIDELSQDIREGVGESLRNIRAGQPLEQATTSSFEALRLYTSAERAEARGEYDEALRLLDEAVSLDPEFAMAYRRMAVLHSNMGTDPDLARAAARQAYEHRDRLTDRERYLTEAYYHDNISGDAAAVEAAYRNVLRVAPDDAAALNNLSLVLRNRGDYDEAIALLERAVNGAGASSVASWNLVATNVQAGNLEAAREADRSYRERYPAHIFRFLSRVWVASLAADVDGLHDLARELDRAPPGAFREWGARAVGVRDLADGRWREGMAHLEEAAVIAELDEVPGGAVAQRLAARVLIPLRWGVATAGVAAALQELRASFEAVEPGHRPWGTLVDAYLALGDVDQAETVYQRWGDEVPEADRPEGFARARRESGASIMLAKGDAVAAARELEGLRRELRCTVCVRFELAEAYTAVDRAPEAIELLLDIQRGFDSVFWYPLDHLHAAQLLGPLFETVGDTAAAAEQYSMLVEAWGDGDPEVRSVAQDAQARIAALGG